MSAAMFTIDLTIIEESRYFMIDDISSVTSNDIFLRAFAWLKAFEIS